MPPKHFKKHGQPITHTTPSPISEVVEMTIPDTGKEIGFFRIVFFEKCEIEEGIFDPRMIMHGFLKILLQEGQTSKIMQDAVMAYHKVMAKGIPREEIAAMLDHEYQQQQSKTPSECSCPNCRAERALKTDAGQN